MGRLSSRKIITEQNISNIPNQSGVYLLYRGNKSRYVGSAGLGRLQQRIEQQLDKKRGITSFQYRTTTSEREARKLEQEYRDRLNPGQK